MERGLIFFILVISFAGLIMAPGNSDLTTGTEQTCTDSDNGLNYYEKGKTIVCPPGESCTEPFVDKCYNVSSLT